MSRAIYVATPGSVALARISARTTEHADGFHVSEELAAEYYDHFEVPDTGGRTLHCHLRRPVPIDFRTRSELVLEHERSNKTTKDRPALQNLRHIPGFQVPDVVPVF